MVVELLPLAPRRVLDLGCGDGRLSELVLAARPGVEEIVAVDCSPPMLELARERFASEPRVKVVEGDLRETIARWGRADLVLSGFAIHHLEDERKQDLFAEAARLLGPGGAFVNLEVVASASAARHAEFLAAIGRTADDPEDRLATVEDQLAWMRIAGFADADCLWRWRGFAVLVGRVPIEGLG
jgi:ubiquinone/menaquinone biosynthesis C-methylase UbiE